MSDLPINPPKPGDPVIKPPEASQLPSGPGTGSDKPGGPKPENPIVKPPVKPGDPVRPEHPISDRPTGPGRPGDPARPKVDPRETKKAKELEAESLRLKMEDIRADRDYDKIPLTDAFWAAKAEFQAAWRETQ